MAVKSQKTRRKEIKKSLIEQLRSRGSDIALFADQVDDYMQLWDLKEMLIEDIRETGLRTEDGKDNTSPKQLPIVNRQMLSLLKTLGVTTDNIVGEEDDDL
jgi:hypothetical protein